MNISWNMLLLLPIAALCGYVHGEAQLLSAITKKAHDLAGTVYVADISTLLIKGFTYDGEGPDAYFYVGTSGLPSSEGHKIPNEKGSEKVLAKYEGADIFLRLPSNIPVTDILWFSVWCKNFTVDFGGFTLDTKFDANMVPEQAAIGMFSTVAHSVKSGPVTLLDERTMLIQDLEYDGLGPDAFFWASTADTPNPQGTKLPDENGSMATKLSTYAKKDVTLILPEGRKFSPTDVRSVSIYCIKYDENFGHVVTSGGDLNLPPYMADAPMQPPMNCEMLSDQLNVGWEVKGDELTVELMGAIDDDGYIAFGVSGADTTTQMVDGDVTVASYQTEPLVEDYYLQSKAFCSGSTGVCPDSGANDAKLVMAKKNNGVIVMRYTRPLNTGETTDRMIVPAEERSYIWAIGKKNSDGKVTKHTKLGGKMLQLNRAGKRNCVAVAPPKPVDPVTGWSENVLRADQLEGGIIVAKIGPTGGEKGYNSITGRTSWGIAWYLNGYLIPKLIIKRGDRVTFKVYGGDNNDNTAKYHPLYITSDPSGGYASYATPPEDHDKLAGEVDGPYCEYQENPAKPPSMFDNFDDYAETLTDSCAGKTMGTPGNFTWTPNANTPDLVYYHCYTHQNLGWKIEVVDEYPVMDMGGGSTLLPGLISLILAALTTLLWA